MSSILSNTLNRNIRWLDRLKKEEGYESIPVTGDDRLLHRVAAGDEVAFDELYRRYNRSVYNYLLRLVREPAEAEDILQDVFVAVWKGAGSFKGKSKVKTWMLQIAHNKAVSWLRKKMQEVSVVEDLGEAALIMAGVDQSLEKRGGDQLQLALERLSPKHRAVVELSFAHGLSQTEIAEVIGCPLGTIKSRMSYALHYLSDAMEQPEKDITV